MADFSFLSDSDESAVEELLSQALDHSVLEQVAAINCSGFTSDSVLPSNLETRFQKLKSFPVTKTPKSPSLSTAKNSASSSFNSQHLSVKSLKPQSHNELTKSDGPKTELDSLSDDESMFISPSKENPVERKGLKPKSQAGSVPSPSKSSNSSPEKAIFPPSKGNTDRKMGLKSKTRSGSSLSPSNSWNSSMELQSPPRNTGCFWCSPKKVSRKKNKENFGLDWGKNDEFLSELSTFSAKGQQKMLKKAMKEEEKINREAEKIVKWAKQASARMEVSGLEDELMSDNESTK
ncbi:uncharacterized protein LOC132308824 [Cornus florida]|uniref:uncharacterized protein LOC132308824 n=1 Tax=Cornus florida TaxID=4283 RepID=UPI00289947E1|nr:uncharacterized protein LOC132308824 [Cornus florida]